jgi:twitching motility protein PilT
MSNEPPPGRPRTAFPGALDRPLGGMFDGPPGGPPGPDSGVFDGPPTGSFPPPPGGPGGGPGSGAFPLPSGPLDFQDRTPGLGGAGNDWQSRAPAPTPSGAVPVLPPPPPMPGYGSAPPPSGSFPALGDPPGFPPPPGGPPGLGGSPFPPPPGASPFAPPPSVAQSGTQPILSTGSHPAMQVQGSQPAAPPPPSGPAEAARPSLSSAALNNVSIKADSFLGKLLRRALDEKASDLHLHPGVPPMARHEGKLSEMQGTKPMSAEQAEKGIAATLGPERWAFAQEIGEIDFVAEMDGVGRFRANAFRQRRGWVMIFRLIPDKAPKLSELGLPTVVSALANYRTGIVLCTGPMGCGKSTTLAALINEVAGSRKEHILTLEDPIEFLYKSSEARVNQRQIGLHSASFARALKAALREDPDIIAVTELRDRETISLAMTAAETGHLVLGTLHTQSAVQTIGRLINSFAADEQAQIRVMLSESLRAVLSQRLIPRADGKGRVPAVEVLLVTPAVGNLIRDGKAYQIPSAMQVGKSIGMQNMNDSLDDLVKKGVITAEEAKKNLAVIPNFE